MVKAKVINFRRSLKHLIRRHFIIDAGCKNKEEAKKLVGKTVEWKSPSGKILSGKVSSSHGNKGMIRAVFEQGEGLPGQAMNTECEVK